METAKLCFIPDYKDYSSSNTAILVTGTLDDIIYHLSFYKNEKQLLENPVYAARVRDFLRSNGILVAKNPYVGIVYVKSEKESEILVPLYGQAPIRVRNDLSTDSFSEVEKARKLILNSKNQLFAEMVLMSKRLEVTTKHLLQITREEAKLAKSFGLEVSFDGEEYLISIREMLRYRVLKYRSNNPSLGALRRLTEDACEVWKDKIASLNTSNPSMGYYYQMYLRQLMNTYDDVKLNDNNVRNLYVRDSSINRLGYGYSTIKSTQSLSIAATPKHKSLGEGSKISDQQAA